MSAANRRRAAAEAEGASSQQLVHGLTVRMLFAAHGDMLCCADFISLHSLQFGAFVSSGSGFLS